MSLNVYLFITKPYCECCKREEEKSMVFHANITSNLWEVAENVGIYKCVWKPREIGIIKAGDLILVKGSQNELYLERVVELLLLNKKDKDLLPRRGSFWDKKRRNTP